ncbi:cell envelope biogenesis protein TolA [Planktotalea sp.]|uniref:cell envelope biogenesis protein TolA n=1 Tax=Planktotalea sp. TaxID=2029877 RepID=UPI003D6B6D87
MQKSTYISAGGHALVLGYALFGGLFSAEPLELPSMDVSVVSEAEFAALTQAAQPPDVPQDAPEPILSEPSPEPEPEPIVPTPEPEPQPRPEPQQIIMPEPIAPPEAPEPVPEPRPEPEPEPAPEPTPEPEAVVIPDTAPQTSLRPKPRPADRVAAQAVAAPDPDVAIDNAAQEASQPDPDASQTLDEQSETAPEEATTEIVTEAEQPASSAPSSSTRPRARPRETAQSEPDTSAAVNAALAEALAEPAASDAPSGPALTAGETNALRLAVQNCWVVDVGSQAANVSVVVGMSMDLRGKVIPGSLRLVSSKGGEGVAIETAYQAARRAVLRCQQEGYDLPEEKYEQWKEIEMTFNPKDMRIR